jgi:hypothetical protein
MRIDMPDTNRIDMGVTVPDAVLGRNEDVPIDLLSGSYIAPINGEAGGLMGSAGANIPTGSHTMPTWMAIWDEENSERFDRHGS